MAQRARWSRDAKKGFDTVVIAVIWALWKQRNARVFNRTNQQLNAPDLARSITGELREWKAAGLGEGRFAGFCETVGLH